MTFKQIKAYIGVLLLGTTLGAALMPKDAKADIAEATATIEAMGIKSNPENIANTDLVINLKDTLKEYTTTGSIPTKYDELVISPELIIDGFHYTVADFATKNLENYTKYLNGEASEFNYVSFGATFADDETKKEVFGILARMVQEYLLQPSVEYRNVILAYIRENTAIIGTGAGKAFLADLLVLNGVDSLFAEPIVAEGFIAPKLGVDATVLSDIAGDGEQTKDMLQSFGDNANEVTFIKKLANQGC